MHPPMMPGVLSRSTSTLRRVALASALPVLLAACAGSRARDTVVYASGADLESANPLVTIHSLSRQLQRYALFVTLARYDAALRPRPYFARSWAWSADRRTLTLRLEPGLRWHDGRATTARDVAFTLDAARDPATGYARAADLAGIVAVDAPDSATVALHFRSPPPGFPPVLCELPVLPEHLLAQVPRDRMRQSAFSTSPIGNGPFRFVSRVPGQRWVFERDDAFPLALGGPPALRRLVVAVVDEAATKFAGLVSGELDVAGIAPASARLVARDATLRVVEYPVLSATAIVFNTTAPPFDDRRVRRAIGASLDRERIVRVALAGYASPATGPVSPASPLALTTLTVRDTALADSLLDAAGWRRSARDVRARNGRRLAIELLTVGTGDNAIEQLVQADLAARGITVEIRQLELGALLTRARSVPRRFDALLTGVPGDLSLAYIAAMYDSRLAGGTLDYGGYHTPRLDSLFDRTREASDTLALRDAWYDVQRELAREAPAAWIYHSRGVQGVSRRLGGVVMDLRGELATLSEWRVVPPSGAAAP